MNSEVLKTPEAYCTFWFVVS